MMDMATADLPEPGVPVNQLGITRGYAVVLPTTQVLAEYVLHADEICDNGFCEITPTDRPLPISSDLIVQVRGENSYRVGIWDTVSFQNTDS